MATRPGHIRRPKERAPAAAKTAAKPSVTGDAKPKGPAEWAYDRLILYIRNFESQLDARHEIAMGFAGNDAGVMRIEGIGFFDPDILTFYGSDEAGGGLGRRRCRGCVRLMATGRSNAPRDRLS
jgi:hypothetical protein